MLGRGKIIIHSSLKEYRQIFMRVHYVNHLRNAFLACTEVEFTRVQSLHDIYTLFYGPVATNLSRSLLTMTGHILELWRAKGWSSRLVG
jgi:hypothetical protein